MQFSLLDWLVSSSILIKIILAVLFLMSIFSWGLTLAKYWQLKNTQKNINSYIKLLNLQPDLQKLEQLDKTNKVTDSSFILSQAILSFDNAKHLPLDLRLNNTERNIYMHIDDKFSNFSKNTSVLALMANIAPYIGLLGTVIGIINTFLNLGESAGGIQQIAPSIAESLIVTAMGLVVAIPANIAYGYFVEKLNDIQLSLYRLKDNIMNLLTLN